MRNIEKEIFDTKQRLAELEKEKIKFDKLPEDQRLAEVIHSRLCNQNHTDGCSWCYETWENPGYSKKEYLGKTKKILNETSYDEAINVFKCL